eukprot:scaffold15947_cov140-Skeletonema_menzelii.AAC.1
MPFDIKLFAFYLVSYPEIVLFHGAGTVFLDCVVGNARGRGVVAMYWGRWLRVSQFLKGEPEDFGFFAVMEESP